MLIIYLVSYSGVSNWFTERGSSSCKLMRLLFEASILFPLRYQRSKAFHNFSWRWHIGFCLTSIFFASYFSGNSKISGFPLILFLKDSYFLSSKICNSFQENNLPLEQKVNESNKKMIGINLYFINFNQKFC